MRSAGKLEGLERSIYPGYEGTGNSSLHNLSTYSEGIKGADRKLAFDIERRFFWDPKKYTLLNYVYSMMIDGSYQHGWWPFKDAFPRPTFAQVRSVMSRESGYVLVKNDNQVLKFANPDRNVFVSLSDHPGSRLLGVVQENQIPDLEQVLNDIVPYAVGLFNRLSPVWKVSETIMVQSIAVARQSVQVVPECRLKQCPLW